MQQLKTVLWAHGLGSRLHVVHVLVKNESSDAL